MFPLLVGMASTRTGLRSVDSSNYSLPRLNTSVKIWTGRVFSVESKWCGTSVEIWSHGTNSGGEF